MGDSDDDAADIFGSALSTLYGIHQPAHGGPGQVLTFQHDGLDPIRFRVPDSAAKDTRLMAHYQWDAGYVLSRLIVEQSVLGTQDCKKDTARKESRSSASGHLEAYNVRKLDTLEVGAGSGLPSLVAAAMGARAVVTDYPSASIIDNITENVRLAAHGRSEYCCKVAGLEWGIRADEIRALGHIPTRSPPRHGFDRVLAADTLWLSSGHANLVATIRRMLARTPDARVLLVAGLHTGRGAVARFLAAASKRGLMAIPDAEIVGDVANTPEQSDWESKPLVPDSLAYMGGVWMRDCEGNEQEWTAEVPDGMEDIDENARWTVLAILKWMR